MAGCTVVVIAGILLALPRPASADDGGKSSYLLGMRGPLAAFVPKPGWYLTDSVYHYDAHSDDFLPIADRIVQQVDAKATLNIAQLTWVTELQPVGGRLAVSAVLPYGRVDVRGGGSVQLPDGTEIGRNIQDSVTGIGDPVIGASLGWKKRDGDRFRAWSVYSSVFIPIGDYKVGRLANVGNNRWALDVGGAWTMANFKGGRELSAVMGLTFNDDNLDTGYSSGTDLHLEIAAKQHLPKNWSVGLVGYWFEQLTADSGGPAILGDFKGRVFAIGPEASWQATVGRVPVGFDLRWYHEFAAQNRLEGDGVFLTFSVPLKVKSASQAQTDWSADSNPAAQ
jgi:hypothetical protein